MTTIQPGPIQNWDAFHYNQRRLAEIHTLGRAEGPQSFASSAAALGPYLRVARDACRSAAVLGSGWSLSDLIGWDGRMLASDGFDSLAWATPDQLLDQAQGGAAKRLIFAGGGVKGARLVSFAESHGWTLQTSGSYLGQSLAGSIATGVNGSRLGYGGFQNQVRGLHLVTSADHSVWIEPASHPALRDEAAAIFAPEIIRDDAVFADVLVHLGGLGFVNGLLIELVPVTGFQVLAHQQTVDRTWLEWLRDGNFPAIAAWLGQAETPEQRLAYYEVQLDPFNWDNLESPNGSGALHTLYFERSGAFGQRGEDIVDLPRVQGGFGPVRRGESDPPPWEVEDLFAAYSATKFKERKPGDGPPQGFSWGALHHAPPDENWRPLIYSAAIAIDRARIDQAIPAMGQAIRAMEIAKGHKRRQLIFTLRFVRGAAGTLAFTRWADSVVIDLEGVMDASEWMQNSDHPPENAASAEVAKMALTALEREGIPYTQHWGKYTPLQRMNVEREFGPGTRAQSPLARWRSTRERLLQPDWRSVFINEALVKWGIC